MHNAKTSTLRLNHRGDKRWFKNKPAAAPKHNTGNIHTSIIKLCGLIMPKKT